MRLNVSTKRAETAAVNAHKAMPAAMCHILKKKHGFNIIAEQKGVA